MGLYLSFFGLSLSLICDSLLRVIVNFLGTFYGTKETKTHLRLLIFRWVLTFSCCDY